MAFEFRPYIPPHCISQEWKKRRDAVSLPQSHIYTSNSAEDLNGIWSPQRTGETIKEITDKTFCFTDVDSPDELPSIEELLKAIRPPNGNTSATQSIPSPSTSPDCIRSSTPHAQIDSDTESSGKSQDHAIIIDEDTNLDQNSSRSLQSPDVTFLAPVNVNTDESTTTVGRDADDDQLSATEELLHAPVEPNPGPTHCETTDIPIDSSIEAPRLDAATKMGVETASLENSDVEAQKESTSTSPPQDGPPPPPPVMDEMSEDEWEAIGIIGEEMINGKLHYIVDWKPTPVPKEDCVNMGKLVDEWEKSKTRGRKGGKRIRRPAAELAQDPPMPPPVTDEMSEDEWEALEIIGEVMINGKLHYIVDWKPTPVPKEDCVNMGKLVDEWEKSKTHGRKGGKRTRRQAAQLAREVGVSKKATRSHEQAKKSNKQDSTKRPRGRPRKA